MSEQEKANIESSILNLEAHSKALAAEAAELRKTLEAEKPPKVKTK
jgi:hypothetical protein